MPHNAASGEHMREITRLASEALMKPAGKDPKVAADYINRGMQTTQHEKIHTKLMSSKQPRRIGRRGMVR